MPLSYFSAMHTNDNALRKEPAMHRAINSFGVSSG
jgi:hypothetical protein